MMTTMKEKEKVEAESLESLVVKKVEEESPKAIVVVVVLRAEESCGKLR